MSISTIWPSEIDLWIIDDFYHWTLNEKIKDSKELIYSLYYQPEVGLSPKKLLKIKKLKQNLNDKCKAYKEIVMTCQSFITDNFGLKDLSILKRNFNEVVREIDAISELYTSFEVRRIAHNIILDYNEEEISYIQDTLDNAEKLNINYLDDKINIIQQYINSQNHKSQWI